jgi:hypothetical protein
VEDVISDKANRRMAGRIAKLRNLPQKWTPPPEAASMLAAMPATVSSPTDPKICWLRRQPVRGRFRNLADHPPRVELARRYAPAARRR